MLGHAPPGKKGKMEMMFMKHYALNHLLVRKGSKHKGHINFETSSYTQNCILIDLILNQRTDRGTGRKLKKM